MFIQLVMLNIEGLTYNPTKVKDERDINFLIILKFKL